MRFIFKIFIRLILLVAVLIAILSTLTPKADTFTYGVSFSRFHVDELQLDWKEVYLALLNDLKVRYFRFSAHWPLTEPANNQFNFRELDFQMQEARKVGAHVIFAVGRRLPGWPECHIPQWVANLSKDEFQKEILAYIDIVVRRYRDYDNILYWQVENEPYLTLFAEHVCGANLDEAFLKKEIELVKSLDPDRPILLTDSGELSVWYGAYKNGDIFGTSIYRYIWNRDIGKFRYPMGSWFFRAKKSLLELVVGEKPSLVIELSAEPWLLQPILDTPLDLQLSRMDINKFNEMLELARGSGFDTYYLWGAEWWYWLKQKQEHPEFWEAAKEIFAPK